MRKERRFNPLALVGYLFTIVAFFYFRLEQRVKDQFATVSLEQSEADFVYVHNTN